MKRYLSLILAIAATVSAQIVPSTGNVRGPTSATDNAVARYDGTTGKLIQNSGVTIDDSGNLTVTGTGTIAGLTLSGGSFAAASLYKSASLGTVLSGATGSSYDLFISNPAGNHIIQTPTGTRGIEVAGNISSGGNITASGTGSIIGDLSSFSNLRSIGATNTIRVRGNSQYIDFTNSAESGYVSGTIIANTLNLFGNNGTGLSIESAGNATFTGQIQTTLASSSSNALLIAPAGGADRKLAAFQVSGTSNGVSIRYVSATGKVVVNFTDLPTSSSGLSTGDLWNDGGTLKIVP